MIGADIYTSAVWPALAAALFHALAGTPALLPERSMISFKPLQVRGGLRRSLQSVSGRAARKGRAVLVDQRVEGEKARRFALTKNRTAYTCQTVRPWRSTRGQGFEPQISDPESDDAVA